jgi:Family of unknown function (DUF6502)
LIKMVDSSNPQSAFSESAAPTGNATPAGFVRALRHVLRPMVRLMLVHGVTYPYLSNLLKGLFVEVADKEFRLHEKPPTDSRVSLLTGVHRKDVSRLRGEMASEAELVPPVVSLGAHLVAKWLGSPQYLDSEGSPLPLQRFASDGGEQSFEALVASVNSDIRSRVVLDEWLRLGVVHLDDDKRVCLNTEAFVPAEGFEEKLFYFGHNLHDHAAAAAHNLIGGNAPFLERSLHYDELSAESVAKLRKQAEQAGMRALLAVNQNAMKLEQQDIEAAQSDPHNKQQRITFGIYFYTEPTALPSSKPQKAPQSGDTA